MGLGVCLHLENWQLNRGDWGVDLIYGAFLGHILRSADGEADWLAG